MPQKTKSGPWYFLLADVFRKLVAIHTRDIFLPQKYVLWTWDEERILKYMFVEQFIIKKAERLAFEKGAWA